MSLSAMGRGSQNPDPLSPKGSATRKSGPGAMACRSGIIRRRAFVKSKQTKGWATRPRAVSLIIFNGTSEHQKLRLVQTNRGKTTLAILREPHVFSKRLFDLCLLIGSALIVCILLLGAFLLAEVRHLNAMWVFLSWLSIMFVVGAREEYRKEFKSPR